MDRWPRGVPERSGAFASAPADGATAPSSSSRRSSSLRHRTAASETPVPDAASRSPIGEQGVRHEMGTGSSPPNPPHIDLEPSDGRRRGGAACAATVTDDDAGTTHAQGRGRSGRNERDGRGCGWCRCRQGQGDSSGPGRGPPLTPQGPLTPWMRCAPRVRGVGCRKRRSAEWELGRADEVDAAPAGGVEAEESHRPESLPRSRGDASARAAARLHPA